MSSLESREELEELDAARRYLSLLKRRYMVRQQQRNEEVVPYEPVRRSPSPTQNPNPRPEQDTFYQSDLPPHTKRKREYSLFDAVRVVAKTLLDQTTRIPITSWILFRRCRSRYEGDFQELLNAIGFINMENVMETLHKDYNMVEIRPQGGGTYILTDFDREKMQELIDVGERDSDVKEDKNEQYSGSREIVQLEGERQLVDPAYGRDSDQTDREQRDDRRSHQ